MFQKYLAKKIAFGNFEDDIIRNDNTYKLLDKFCLDYCEVNENAFCYKDQLHLAITQFMKNNNYIPYYKYNYIELLTLYTKDKNIYFKIYDKTILGIKLLKFPVII